MKIGVVKDIRSPEYILALDTSCTDTVVDISAELYGRYIRTEREYNQLQDEIEKYYEEAIRYGRQRNSG